MWYLLKNAGPDMRVERITGMLAGGGEWLEATLAPVEKGVLFRGLYSRRILQIESEFCKIGEGELVGTCSYLFRESFDDSWEEEDELDPYIQERPVFKEVMKGDVYIESIVPDGLGNSCVSIKQKSKLWEDVKSDVLYTFCADSKKFKGNRGESVVVMEVFYKKQEGVS